jgi:hypothetical protein
MAMGTLGQYLLNARLAMDIDLRDAAQQTRISIQYLRALENEDFSKLPGEVFVKGFLKNYGRFLKLDESEVMKRYAELKPNLAPSFTPPPSEEYAVLPSENHTPKGTSLEPFVWGTVLIVSILIFLFTSLPTRPSKDIQQPAGSVVPPVLSRETASIQGSGQTEKLYLEVIALEDTWLLVRTDDSPEKKAVLKRGESLTWSADERFLLSYGRIEALKLVLNGVDLSVNGTRDTVVRDLAITRAGIVNQPVPVRQARPMKPAAEPQQVQQGQQDQKVRLQQTISHKPLISGQTSTPLSPALSPALAPGALPAR